MYRQTFALAALLALPAVATAADPLPGTPPAMSRDVTAVVMRLGELFTDIGGPQPITLFDRSWPAPQYLGEEMDDWMIGWEDLDWYFGNPARWAAVEAMDYHPSNVRVRALGPDLALATWDVLAEMKFRRGPPMGERLRANGILRRTDDGWRFIYYAEAAKSTLAYITDLYEAMSSEDFRARFDTEAKDALTTPPGESPPPSAD